MKRCIAFTLVLTALLSLTLPFSANAAADFPDITDPDVARDVAILQMLGVISGDDQGNFNPYNTLTRAEFCKMAIVIMGSESLEPQFRNRTIFPDVRSSHWAIGFINLASSSVESRDRFISGYPDGTFKPDEIITCGQAVTILMRILGYDDADAGFIWPEGYMSLAGSAGLLDGVAAGANDQLPRYQAARMFRNLLGLKTKANVPYMEAMLGATMPPGDVIILGVDADAPGSAAVLTTAGSYQPRSIPLPPSFVGERGTLCLDANNRILTFLPSSGNKAVVTAASAGATFLRDESGRRYEIPPATPVYRDTGPSGITETTYVSVYVDIRAGMDVTLYYAQDGEIDAIYLRTAASAPATNALVFTTGADFQRGMTALTNGEDYTLYRNGVRVTRSALSANDVITYDPVTRRADVCDFRLTGVIENIWPNTQTPLRVNIMGARIIDLSAPPDGPESPAGFSVLPSAIESLSKFNIGDRATLLFTADGQIAGAAEADEVHGNALGIVASVGTGSATINILNAPVPMTVSGNPKLSSSAAEQFTSELVRVSSFEPGHLSMGRIIGPGARGDLDVVNKTVDGLTISPAVRVFERVGRSSAVQIEFSSLTQTVIPAGKVTYIGRNAAGVVDTLVLDDVSGDLYVYGFFDVTISYQTVEVDPGSGGDPTDPEYVPPRTHTNRTTEVGIINSGGGTAFVNPGYAGEYRSGEPGGMACTANNADATGLILLTAIEDVPRTAFYTDSDGNVTLVYDDMTYPVWDGVECYNGAAHIWFGSGLSALNAARAFADTLTVYFDRDPAEGGKIRMVIAG